MPQRLERRPSKGTTNPAPPKHPEDSPSIPFREALGVWLRIAAHSFGGPAGQIAVMHRLLVDEKRWLGERRFLHALNYCMLLPGPEAQQLATYTGWLIHGVRGGLVAGTLFILPGFVSILLLSILYAGYQDLSFVAALFYGLKPAVLAVVLVSVARIARRALSGRAMLLIAACAFIAIFAFHVPFPWIVGTAALLGWALGRAGIEGFDPDGDGAGNPADRAKVAAGDPEPRLEAGRSASAAASSREGRQGTIGTDPESESERGHASNSSAEGSTESVQDADRIPGARPSSTRSTLATAMVFLALWLGSLLLIHLALGPDQVFTRIAFFFSKAAVVTFGGAYAVLAYMAQEAVNTYGWLNATEMLDGLGLAETTPGPLIQVVQFVGFLAAYRDAGAFSPIVAGTLAALLTTWVTFAPCYVWIFAGAPFIERLRGQKGLSHALSGITAAVVGVMLNLAIFFGVYTLFGSVSEATLGPIRIPWPELGSLDPFALVLAAGAWWAMERRDAGMIRTLLICAGLGILIRMGSGF